MGDQILRKEIKLEKVIIAWFLVIARANNSELFLFFLSVITNHRLFDELINLEIWFFVRDKFWMFLSKALFGSHFLLN